MTIAEKVMRAKTDYDEVYDKAKKSFGVTETVSDVGIVVLEHVNSEPHKVRAELSADEVDLTSVTVTACGVNMFDVSKAKNTYFYNASYGDGVIVSEERISAAPDVPDEYDFFRSDNYSSFGHFCEMNVIPGKTYIWSFDIYSTAPTSTVMYAICTSISWSYNYQLAHSLGRTDYMNVWSHVVRTVTIPDGITKVYLMSERQRFRNMQFELANSESDYEEYTGASYTPAADGTLEIDSISPTMTVFSDNPNVRIECEYYQDGAAVKEELTNTIISLGGTI